MRGLRMRRICSLYPSPSTQGKCRLSLIGVILILTMPWTLLKAVAKTKIQIIIASAIRDGSWSSNWNRVPPLALHQRVSQL